MQEAYTNRVIHEGAVSGVRGQPWAQISKGGVPPYQLLSYGTLTRAIYAAHDRAPTNINVIETVKVGLQNVTLFSENTPVDVLEWLIDFHNSFHQGSSFTVLQHFDLTIKADAEWKVHCTSKGITQTSSGMPKMQKMQD